MSKRTLEEINYERPAKKVREQEQEEPQSITSAQQLRQILVFHQDGVAALLSGNALS